jgi:uncharacterized repeat protein (TIGR03803 family)
MNKGICVGLLTSKPFCILVAVIPLLLLGWLGEAGAQTVSILHQFSGGNDGSEPFFMHLIQASDGDFYGTTSAGGTNSAGTVFKITSAGTLTVLYEFKGAPNDGQFPEAGLLQGSDGNFYGATYEGGSNFHGTVFQMTPLGVLTNIHILGSTAGEGIWPFSQLIQGTDGFFYGTTTAGGTRGDGTVFKINSTGNLSTIYSFTNGLDGSNPYAGVFQGSDGNFYGTTQAGGGNTNCFGGCGTVYKVTPGGVLTTLHQFGTSPSDGQSPIGGIIQGYTGDYYGTTFDGGTNGEGVVFKITSAGTLTVLYQFGAFAYDGLNPRCSLLQGSDSYLYGTTFEGGTNNGAGTLFKIGPEGGLIYVHDFDGHPGDGVFPAAPPVEGYDGNYYGTTFQGGTNQLGTVYKLASPVSSNPNEPSSFGFGNSNGNTNATNNVILSLSTIAGETYQMQFANSLSPTTIWSNVPGSVVSNAIGGPLSFTNLITGIVTHRFYRFDITP